MQEMKNKVEMLHESIEKDFKNSSVLLDSLQGREVNHKSLMIFIEKQLEYYEKERGIFNEICEHSEEVMQVCFFEKSLVFSYNFQTHVK